MFATEEGKQLMKEMGLPEGLGGIGAIALGYPATTPRTEGVKKDMPDHPINASDGGNRLTGCPEEISAFVDSAILTVLPKSVWHTIRRDISGSRKKTPANIDYKIIN